MFELDRYEKLVPELYAVKPGKPNERFFKILEDIFALFNTINEDLQNIKDIDIPSEETLTRFAFDYGINRGGYSDEQLRALWIGKLLNRTRGNNVEKIIALVRLIFNKSAQVRNFTDPDLLSYLSGYYIPRGCDVKILDLTTEEKNILSNALKIIKPAGIRLTINLEEQQVVGRVPVTHTELYADEWSDLTSEETTISNPPKILILKNKHGQIGTATTYASSTYSSILAITDFLDGYPQNSNYLWFSAAFHSSSTISLVFRVERNGANYQATNLLGTKILYAKAGNRVAVLYSDTGIIRYSTDNGATYNQISLSPAHTLLTWVVNPDPTQFHFCSVFRRLSDNRISVIRSTDGITFSTQTTTATALTCSNIIISNGFFIFGANNNILRSSILGGGWATVPLPSGAIEIFKLFNCRSNRIYASIRFSDNRLRFRYSDNSGDSFNTGTITLKNGSVLSTDSISANFLCLVHNSTELFLQGVADTANKSFFAISTDNGLTWITIHESSSIPSPAFPQSNNLFETTIRVLKIGQNYWIAGLYQGAIYALIRLNNSYILAKNSGGFNCAGQELNMIDTITNIKNSGFYFNGTNYEFVICGRSSSGETRFKFTVITLNEITNFPKDSIITVHDNNLGYNLYENTYNLPALGFFRIHKIYDAANNLFALLCLPYHTNRRAIFTDFDRTNLFVNTLRSVDAVILLNNQWDCFTLPHNNVNYWHIITGHYSVFNDGTQNYPELFLLLRQIDDKNLPNYENFNNYRIAFYRFLWDGTKFIYTLQYESHIGFSNVEFKPTGNQYYIEELNDRLILFGSHVAAFRKINSVERIQAENILNESGDILYQKDNPPSDIAFAVNGTNFVLLKSGTNLNYEKFVVSSAEIKRIAEYNIPVTGQNFVYGTDISYKSLSTFNNYIEILTKTQMVAVNLTDNSLQYHAYSTPLPFYSISHKNNKTFFISKNADKLYVVVFDLEFI